MAIGQPQVVKHGRDEDRLIKVMTCSIIEHSPPKVGVQIVVTVECMAANRAEFDRFSRDRRVGQQPVVHLDVSYLE